MSLETVTIRTVLSGGLAGTAEVDATGEIGAFTNPSALPLIPDVTKNLAEVTRTGVPPLQTVVIVLRK